MLVMFLLVFAPFASADTTKHEAISGEHLAAAFDDIKCKADYTVGLLNAVNPTQYSQQTVALQQDLTQLQGYVDKKDVDGFRSYVKDTFDKHLKDTREALKLARQTARASYRSGNQSNVTSTMDQMKSDREKLKATFDACHNDAVKKYASVKVTAYNAILDNYNRKVTELGSKGIDTSGLTTILKDAKSQIVDPLQAALEKASTAKDVHSALQKYCLFDSCKDGMNFHLAAKFELEKLSAILKFLKAKPNAPSDKVTAAQKALDTAKATLAKIGTARYAPGQAQQVWSQIEAAAKAIKELRSSVRSS